LLEDKLAAAGAVGELSRPRPVCPVAGRLATGEPLAALASRAAPRGYPDWPDDLAEIVYIDHFGNALTGLRGGSLPPNARLAAGGHSIAHAQTFASVPHGGRSGTSIRTGWSRSPSTAGAPTGRSGSPSQARSRSSGSAQWRNFSSGRREHHVGARRNPEQVRRRCIRCNSHMPTPIATRRRASPG